MTTKLLPSIVQRTPSPKTSERYVFVDSQEVIHLMAKEGYTVATVTGPQSAKSGAALYARHQIDFRREDWSVKRQDRRGGHVPRMLYTNSHDGTTSASFMLGIYAFVCSNGLVVGSTYARERVRHLGESAASLVGRMQGLAKNVAPLFDQVDAWQRKVLTAPQTQEFARLAAQLRWGDPHRYATTEVLRTRRNEDASADLWTVFNRVQENTVLGGLRGLSATGRAATSRPLSEVGANAQYNADLWRLAEEFAAL